MNLCVTYQAIGNKIAPAANAAAEPQNDVAVTSPATSAAMMIRA